MSSKSLQRRVDGKVQKSDGKLPANSSDKVIPIWEKNQKIVGLSVQGILFITALTVGLFGYGLMSEFKEMRKEMAALKKQNRAVNRFVLDVRNSAPGVTSGELDSKLKLMKNELSYKISQLKPQDNLWIKPEGDSPSAFDRLNQVDLDKYLISNVMAYPNYSRYLSEKSRLRRELSSHLSRVISDYADNHRITTVDESEYLRILSFRDKLMDDHRDLIKENEMAWKKAHQPHSRFPASLRP